MLQANSCLLPALGRFGFSLRRPAHEFELRVTCRGQVRPGCNGRIENRKRAAAPPGGTMPTGESSSRAPPPQVVFQVPIPSIATFPFPRGMHGTGPSTATISRLATGPGLLFEVGKYDLK